MVMKRSYSVASFTAVLLLCGAASAQDFVQNDRPSTLPQTGGKELYNAICAGCHMSDGAGAIGAGKYPPLASNPFVESPEGVAQWIIKGYKAMPPLGDVMNDEQVAAIVNYLRKNLGNNYEGEITPAEVADIRTW